ncbi:hypothetical protein ACFSKL_12315 [Belliella marina]|uniref:Uncharacterized protein n=1 Tax=Belliella marina TaxID=1644146 RepID=A0ABW4VQJ9_9BACT
MTIKAKIIEKIEHIDDEELLNEIYSWVENIEGTGWNHSFEKAEILAVQEGYEQYLAGKTFSQKEASEQFEKWLSQKEK